MGTIVHLRQGCFRGLDLVATRRSPPDIFAFPSHVGYLFGATLHYKINSSSNAWMRGRLVLYGSTEIRGSRGEISGAHASEAAAVWRQTIAPLAQGDMVELQGTFRAADGYFAAEHTSFWGAKVG